MELPEAMRAAIRTQKPNSIGELAVCRYSGEENLCLIFLPDAIGEKIRTANGEEWVPTHDDLVAHNWHLAAMVPNKGCSLPR